MAAASARPMPAAQGAQGSAGVCGGAFSCPGLCPRIWKRVGSKAERVRAGGHGGVPRDQITAPRERGWGVAYRFLSTKGAPPGHNQRHTHTGHTLRVTLHWQAPAPPRHPPQSPPLLYTYSQTLIHKHYAPTTCQPGAGTRTLTAQTRSPGSKGQRASQESDLVVISEGTKCNEQNS